MSHSHQPPQDFLSQQPSTSRPYGRPGVTVLTERSPTGLKTVFRVFLPSYIL
ncbi:hypothetical protein PAXRUDRAFT_21370 [Paxillus rubicundulus Ve08.2h10]|uniref:Uncharacterized protein n=1 Tax=Paxillus rubicundulus Ve08.2h10 TaxID=930991 RepID=A0A0D0CBY6_9AGAM|nr:hypothetical protein PAXRUDRAFT_21370 [Paxillus rubicundulus Ve08.2h10]